MVILCHSNLEFREHLVGWITTCSSAVQVSLPATDSEDSQPLADLLFIMWTISNYFHTTLFQVSNAHICFISYFFFVQSDTAFIILISLHLTKCWLIALLCRIASFQLISFTPTREFAWRFRWQRVTTGHITVHISNFLLLITQTWQPREIWNRSDTGPT
jgi:hypothetical protein